MSAQRTRARVARTVGKVPFDQVFQLQGQAFRLAILARIDEFSAPLIELLEVVRGIGKGRAAQQANGECRSDRKQPKACLFRAHDESLICRAAVRQ